MATENRRVPPTFEQQRDAALERTRRQAAATVERAGGQPSPQLQQQIGNVNQARENLRAGRPTTFTGTPGTMGPNQVAPISDALSGRQPGNAPGMTQARPGGVPQSQLNMAGARIAQQFPGAQPAGISAGVGQQPASTGRPLAPGNMSPERVAFERSRAAASAQPAATPQPAAVAQPAPAAQSAAAQAPKPTPAAQPSAPAAPSRMLGIAKGVGAAAAATEGASQGFRAATGNATPTEQLREETGGIGDLTPIGLAGRAYESAGEQFGMPGVEAIGSGLRDIGTRALGVPVEAAKNIVGGLVSGAQTGARFLTETLLGSPDVDPAVLAPTGNQRPGNQQPGAQPGQQGDQAPAPRPSGFFEGRNGRVDLTEDNVQSIADRLQTAPIAAQGASAQQLGVRQQGGGQRSQAPDAQSEGRVRDLLDTRTPAGQLYARLSQDKTPTGKRVAAQFAEQYLGAGVEEGKTAAGFIGTQDQVAAQRDNAQAQIEAATQQALTRRPRDQVQNLNGQLVSIADGVARPIPLVGADGQPVQSGGDQLTLEQILKSQSEGAIDPADLSPEAQEAFRKRLERAYLGQ